MSRKLFHLTFTRIYQRILMRLEIYIFKLWTYYNSHWSRSLFATSRVEINAERNMPRKGKEELSRYPWLCHHNRIDPLMRKRLRLENFVRIGSFFFARFRLTNVKCCKFLVHLSICIYFYNWWTNFKSSHKTINSKSYTYQISSI